MKNALHRTHDIFAGPENIGHLAVVELKVIGSYFDLPQLQLRNDILDSCRVSTSTLRDRGGKVSLHIYQNGFFPGEAE